MFSILLALNKTPIFFEILFSKRSIWFLQGFHQLYLRGILTIVLFIFQSHLFLELVNSEECSFFSLDYGKGHI